MRTLKLKKKEERRILRGHPWVFSNELDALPRDAAPGELVDVTDHAGRFIGRGYLNPRSLIAVRILSRKQETVDQAFFTGRINAARDLRALLGFGDSCRAVFSESDGLPGLIVDKYGSVLVAQFLTAGMEAQAENVFAALREVYAPSSIVLRNDSAARELEGLPRTVAVLGDPVTGPVEFMESGLRYAVDVREGQKTGFFFDQRENRLALRDLVRGRRTLDCFCYVGAWAITAATFGASETIGIDASERAVALARENAGRNGVQAQFLVADVFDELRRLEKERQRFGCIILDPPAFVKSRARVREGLKGYKEINLRAMRLLERGGFLVTCSCSHHIDQDLFREMLIDASASAGRQLRLLELRSQSRDHPMLLAASETQYLKCVVLQAE